MKYYVIKNKETSEYYRGKGVNKWGKYYNQASIYRIKGTALSSIKDLETWGYNVELVPIKIVETEEEAVDACVYHLDELENENELDGASPDDFTIDTFVVPIEEVNEDSLVRSGLKSSSALDLGTIFHF